jgi:hypothetical protein
MLLPSQGNSSAYRATQAPVEAQAAFAGVAQGLAFLRVLCGLSPRTLRFKICQLANAKIRQFDNFFTSAI